MVISGQYLTYNEYKSLGGTLDQNSFSLLEYNARKEIDLRTRNRLKGLETIPEDVKLCVYNLINTLQIYVQESSVGKVSEKVGNYSVDYGSANEIVQSKKTEIDDIILSDLYGVIVNNEHVIYCGD